MASKPFYLHEDSLPDVDPLFEQRLGRLGALLAFPGQGPIVIHLPKDFPVMAFHALVRHIGE